MGGTNAVPVAVNNILRLNGRSFSCFVLVSKSGYAAFQSGRNTRIVICPMAENEVIRTFWTMAVLPILLRLLRVQVVLSFSSFGIPLSMTRMIFFHSGTQRTTLPREYGFLSRVFMGLSQRLSVRQAKLVIAPSNIAKAELQQTFNVNASKVNVLYFAPRLGATREFSSAPVHASIGRKIVLTVGTTPQKNLARLIESFQLLVREGRRDACLVIVGNRSARLESIIEGLPSELQTKVVLTGTIPDVELMKLYKSADVLAMVSVYETFGYPVLEAMQLGLPVLCSKGTSLGELTGDAALLVNPWDTNEIAAGLRQILEDASLRRILVERGYSQVSRFSWEKTAWKLNSIINSQLV